MQILSNKLLLFFILSFVISWLIWLPSVLGSKGIIDLPEIYGLLSNLATFGPLIAAFIVQRKFRDQMPEPKDTSSRNWMFIIFLTFPFTAGLSYLVSSLIFGWEVPLNIDPIFLTIMFLVGGPFEEFGWRGYALPKLMERYDAFRSTLLLGAIWSLWHLPLHFVEGTTQSFIPIWAFFLLNTTISFFYTILYQNVGRRVWYFVFLHWLGNASAVIFPYWQIGYISGTEPNLWLPTCGMLIGYTVTLVTLLSFLRFHSKASLEVIGN